MENNRRIVERYLEIIKLKRLTEPHEQKEKRHNRIKAIVSQIAKNEITDVQCLVRFQP